MPAAPAKRKITTGERNALDWALTTGASLEEIAKREGRAVGEVQGLMQETGIMLPSQGAKLDKKERSIYLDTVANQGTAWDASQSYGFNPGAVVNRLRETGLRTPLSPQVRQVYDIAEGYGLSSKDVAQQFGSTQLTVDTVLGGAGLSLSGTQQFQNRQGGIDMGDRRPVRMPGYQSFMQNPGLRMVNRQKRRSEDPNWRGTTDTILTSGRGVTDPGNTQVKTLLG